MARVLCGRGPKRGRADDPSAREHFNSTIALFEVSSLAAAAGDPVTLRHDDTVNPVQFAAATGGGANIATIADPLIAAEVLSSGKFAVLKIGFSALHRALLEGHSGFTAAAQKRGTVSYKCAAVAGQDKEAFLEFLDK